ncbi:hypothetical protein FOZ62_011421, partial [Perkinsus olseni]
YGAELFEFLPKGTVQSEEVGGGGDLSVEASRHKHDLTPSYGYDHRGLVLVGKSTLALSFLNTMSAAAAASNHVPSQNEKYQAYVTSELNGIERDLKEWFLTRRFRMERALAIKKELDDNNFTGLSNNAPEDIPVPEKVMWSDIVAGRPSLGGEELSVDAKQRKADTYTRMFDNATDNDHKCRPAGMTFFRCLSSNFASHTVDKECDAEFKAFDQCRQSIVKEQADATSSALLAQDIADRRARALFERRMVLLDSLKAVQKGA